MTFIQLTEPARPATRYPILALAFRPFFLMAAIYASLSVPLWLLIYTGAISPVSYLDPRAWHGHEMVFGFGAAVIAGFLLTAASTWTGRPTVTGLPLAGLAAIWFLGRILLSTGGQAPAWLSVTVDVSFLPLTALLLAIPIIRAGNRRNLAFPVILLLMAALNLVMHLGGLDVIRIDASRVLHAAIDLIILIVTVLGGRVIPSFTQTACPKAKISTCRIANALAIIAAVALVFADCRWGDAKVTGAIALFGSLANILRMRRWGTMATLYQPALWILHLGYIWLIVGLGLRGLADTLDLLPVDAGLHALTAGAIGTMSLGMMSRVALGHTGRKIAMTKPIVAAFIALTLSALMRVAAPNLPASLLLPALIFSGGLWSLAFGLFAWRHLPILVAPRADGRPG